MKKAGIILFSKNKEKVCLVYRDYLDDYSFPKGHLEEGETLIQCAIRETEEETKIKPLIIDNEYILEDKYLDKEGNQIVVIYYIAFEDGKSDNTSLDTHDVIWVNFDEVEDEYIPTNSSDYGASQGNFEDVIMGLLGLPEDPVE